MFSVSRKVTVPLLSEVNVTLEVLSISMKTDTLLSGWKSVQSKVMSSTTNYGWRKPELKNVSRGPKLEGCAFVNFRNSSGTEEEPSQKREKNGGKGEK